MLLRIFTNNGAGVTRESLIELVSYLIALVVAITLHEVAHGLVALWNGDDTAKLAGRLSVNPVAHFDLVGFLMLLFVGFGWAKPVPVNPNNFKNKTAGKITVSLAGVITNLLLAFWFSALLVGMSGLYYNSSYGSSTYYIYWFLYTLGYYVTVINVSLALFNFLPLFPLDGYNFLASFISEDNKFLRFMRKYSLYILLVFVLWDMMPDSISQFSPLNWYIGVLGGYIKLVFARFWGLFF